MRSNIIKARVPGRYLIGYSSTSLGYCRFYRIYNISTWFYNLQNLCFSQIWLASRCDIHPLIALTLWCVSWFCYSDMTRGENFYEYLA